jgi:prepilin-type N-terminal cleavage/methylation domain-containing protein
MIKSEVRECLPRPIVFTSKGGFTLIELLVVCGIIAILVGLILPMANKSVAKARTLSCGNSLKQLGVAMAAYAADSIDAFPLNHDGYLELSTTNKSWVLGTMLNDRERSNTALLVSDPRSLLGKYAGSYGIYRCPTDRSGNVRSYSLNGWINPYRALGDLRWVSMTNIGCRIYRKQSDCLRPSDRFSFIEESQFTINDGYFAIKNGLAPEEYIDVPSTKHEHSFIYLAIDGHLVTQRWSRIPKARSVLRNEQEAVDLRRLASAATGPE